jgi:hypothetical protein
MTLYFLRIDCSLFQDELVPALAASWSRRSFEPCRPLAWKLLDAAETFEQTCFFGPEGPLLRRVADGLRFDRDYWRLLAGEMLLLGAADVPRIETAPELLTCLLAPEHYRMDWQPRGQWPPIQQAHFGSRDLWFGSALYRSDDAGVNDAADTARLAAYLAGIDPQQWRLADLAELRETTDAEERQEGLEFAREWFPALQELYDDAAAKGQVIVCETL